MLALSLPPVPPLPIRTVRAPLASRTVGAFFVRASDDPVRQHDRLRSAPLKPFLAFSHPDRLARRLGQPQGDAGQRVIFSTVGQGRGEVGHHAEDASVGRSGDHRVLHLSHLSIDGAPRDAERFEHVEQRLGWTKREQLRIDRRHDHRQQGLVAHAQGELPPADVDEVRVPLAEDGRRGRWGGGSGATRIRSSSFLVREADTSRR